MFRTLIRHPLEVAVCTILVALVAVTFSQVVFRYVLQASLSWSEELARFLLMWLAALSTAYAMKTAAHFALHFVVDRTPAAMRRLIGSAVALSAAAFLAVFAYQSLRFAIEVHDMLAPATRMSMAVPYSSAFVGSTLTLYYVLVNWRRELRAPGRE
ncbi:MAG: TRAP transporter small permease [Holophagales bacterium]|nr:TRAP transporter small permease [Holophagales bacterium]MYF06007.1 TRAP transporter small permease [Holophagales bacterium]MYJ26780.1 TRAP transporter small permease [Holophagales bacterium]